MSTAHRFSNVVTQFPMYAIAVTPSDSVEFVAPSTVYVGIAGDVVVEPWEGGNTVTFTVGAGGVVPVLVKRVLAATTASALVRVYY